MEYPNGSRAYLQDGELHRLDGPAIEAPDGEQEYHIYGNEVDEATHKEFNEALQHIQSHTREFTRNIDDALRALALALMSGVMLFVMGLLRLGTLIRFIPVAVIIGFTNGIAVLIVLSQLKDFFGLSIRNMPADFVGMVSQLSQHAHTFSPVALGLALVSLAVLLWWQFGLPRLLSKQPRLKTWLGLVPASLMALILASVAAQALGLNVETIGTRFGSIPHAMPEWRWPEVDVTVLRQLLPSAVTLALLGAIESLLCARVADQLIDDRHDANQELLAQGIANPATSRLASLHGAAGQLHVSPHEHIHEMCVYAEHSGRAGTGKRHPKLSPRG